MGKAQHAAPGEEKEPLALRSKKLGKQDSLPWQEQQAGGKSSVPCSLCREMEAWLLRRHEGTTRAGIVLPSEKGV